LIIFIVAGCASAPVKVEQGPVFYPEPPAPPRIQYLISYTSGQDLGAKKSAFEIFVTGEKERVQVLDKPYGVAIHDGKIYVCDTNATVMVFDLKQKTFEPLKGAQGLGKLVQPINISIDKDGNKYVTDPFRGQVVIYDKNDFYVKAFGVPGEWKPVDAAVYEDRLYVADIQSSEIKVFDKETGDITFRIGQAKDETFGRLVAPTNIAFDKEGYLYVADAGRFQVVKLDRDGHIKKTIGELGDRLGSFARPRGIAVDREGRLYAVDAAFDNVQIFNKEGRLLFFFGKAGKKPGDLFLPAKIAVDYDNISYFQQYADPRFEIEALLLVVSQFGDRMVNVYALGKEKGKKYPTEEELMKQLEEKKQKFKQEHPEETGGAEKGKEEAK
jgi:DNA-binding beta-propeller fold protein YncE